MVTATGVRTSQEIVLAMRHSPRPRTHERIETALARIPGSAITRR
ncbi:MAG TPA: hypothetical protein VK698_10785 [Kofleriaceae bacterium]|jgi:hypothetical protein|nr:hypothetical protein [Kofleriaceae bacterium]